MCFNPTLIDSHGHILAWSTVQSVQAPNFITDEIPELMRTMGLATYDPLLQHLSSMHVLNPALPAYLPADDDEDAYCNFISHMDNPFEYAYGDSDYALASRMARSERRRHLRNAGKKENISASALVHNRICTIKELLGSSTKGTTLNDLQKTELDAVLDRCSDAFAMDSNDFGKVTKDLHIEHVIDTGTARPVSQKGYRLSHHEMEFLKQQLADLIAKGLIRPSSSPWMSPVVLVTKKDGSLRLCIDFRALNAATARDAYPLPRTDDILSRMKGCRYFTSLDVQAAFWNVPVNPSDIPKTGFTTPFGNFEWVAMPFGLVNASSTFQRLIDTVLSGCAHSAAYIDDCFVASETWEEHLVHLEETLQRFIKAGLKLKLSKCAFACEAVKCLGHIVDEAGLHVDPDKVTAIKSIPAPRDATGVRSFLGMTNYFRQFIPEYAKISMPLQDLTKKRTKFEWTQDCEDAFSELKQCLCRDPCLIMPDFTQPFTLHTDWSKCAIGAVLSQTGADGLDHPIAFASRTLNPAERNYAPTEGECLALVWAVKKFRHYYMATPSRSSLTMLLCNGFTGHASPTPSWSAGRSACRSTASPLHTRRGLTTLWLMPCLAPPLLAR